jgi:cell division transport system permease protein
VSGELVQSGLPRRGRPSTVARNFFDLTFAAGYRGWSRNIAGTTPALASIALLALLAGIAAVIAIALSSLAAAQADQAALLHVYLKDDATQEQVGALMDGLRRDQRVASVLYLTKADALAKAERRPGMTQLVDASGTNPFPTSIEVRLRSLGDVGTLANSVSSAIGVDSNHPDSYDPNTYAPLQEVLRTAAFIGAGLLALLLAITAAVTAGAIRSTLLARREEVEVMWLVGSPPWMIRGPFLVEGALIGCAGAGIGSILAVGLALVAVHAQAATMSEFLPGVTDTALAILLCALLAAGVGLGSVSALVGVRDLRR